MLFFNFVKKSTSAYLAVFTVKHPAMSIKGCPESVRDISSVITAIMEPEEVANAVAKFSEAQKYDLLRHHFKPISLYVFPQVFDCGQNRAFQYNWLGIFPWMVYSKAVDGFFCIQCVLFAKFREQRGKFVTSLHKTWQNLRIMQKKLRKNTVP